MSTFVLVHGAWHGGWCWERVAPRLTAAGHDVVAPTLRGLAERAGELATGVRLADHVADVVAVLDRRREPVVLVGHSYSGLVVRQAADQRPDAVAGLVLLDAWIGPDGSSLYDLAPDWLPDVFGSASGPDGVAVLPVPPAAMVGVDEPDDVAWLEAHLTPHPRATVEDPTSLTGAVDAVAGLALVCSPGVGLPFVELATSLGYPVQPIESGHDAMVTAPAELAAALERFAAGA